MMSTCCRRDWTCPATLNRLSEGVSEHAIEMLPQLRTKCDFTKFSTNPRMPFILFMIEKIICLEILHISINPGLFSIS